MVQSVLLYGSDTCNISYNMCSNVRSLQNGVSISLSRKNFDICPDTGDKIYSSITEIMSILELEEIEYYIKKIEETLINTMESSYYDKYVLNKCVGMGNVRKGMVESTVVIVYT